MTGNDWCGGVRSRRRDGAAPDPPARGGAAADYKLFAYISPAARRRGARAHRRRDEFEARRLESSARCRRPSGSADDCFPGKASFNPQQDFRSGRPTPSAARGQRRARWKRPWRRSTAPPPPSSGFRCRRRRSSSGEEVARRAGAGVQLGMVHGQGRRQREVHACSRERPPVVQWRLRHRRSAERCSSQRGETECSADFLIAGVRRGRRRSFVPAASMQAWKARQGELHFFDDDGTSAAGRPHAARPKLASSWSAVSGEAMPTTMAGERRGPGVVWKGEPRRSSVCSNSSSACSRVGTWCVIWEGERRRSPRRSAARRAHAARPHQPVYAHRTCFTRLLPEQLRHVGGSSRVRKDFAVLGSEDLRDRPQDAIDSVCDFRVRGGIVVELPKGCSTRRPA